jgi:hypothetical protein
VIVTVGPCFLAGLIVAASVVNLAEGFVHSPFGIVGLRCLSGAAPGMSFCCTHTRRAFRV